MYLISLMWHVSITVINPFPEEEKIWHDIPLKDVEIVLAYNGCNHYSGSIFIKDTHIRLSPHKFRVTFKKLPEGFPRKPNLAPDEIKTEREETEMDINEHKKQTHLTKTFLTETYVTKTYLTRTEKD